MQRLPFSCLGAVALGALVLACSNLDPNDFGAPLDAVHGGQAGYSYDAGAPVAGSASRAGSGGKPSSNDQPPKGAGGTAGATGGDGEAGADGALGAAGDVGTGGLGGADDGSGGTAGSGGRAAGASGGSSSGAGGVAAAGASGLGGRSGWGGRAGASAGGRGGRAGVAGAGGVGGDGERAGHGGVAGSAPPEPEPEHDFVFSEYVESGGKKALEIRAGRASSLAGCRVVTYFNGAVSGSGVVLEGDVASGDVYVLCSAKLEEELAAVCDRAAGLRFNGDDAITLECGGAVIDAIGQIGVDPGTAWEGGGAATLKQTLRRRCSAPSGDGDATDAFDPSVAWLPLPVDTFDGLGQPECG